MTVLVVDDRPVNRDLVRTVLGYHGHRIIEADGGVRALEMVRRERPDLVITDVLMPDMDGYEFVRELRADPATHAIPVIFYTANYLEEEVRPIAAALGVSDVVTKTGDLAALVHAVDAALAGAPPMAPPVADDDFDRSHLRVLNAKLLEKIHELEDKERLHELVDAAVSVSGDLNLAATLRRIASAGRSLVAAHSAELRIFSDDGQLSEVVRDGGDIQPVSELARCDRLSVPIRVRGLTYAELNLVGRGGAQFSPRDEVLLAALAAAGGAAIANARLYEDARRRQEWLKASAEITSALLAAESAGALELVVRGVRRVAGARVAWVEIAAGDQRVAVDACDGSGSAEVNGRVMSVAEAPMLREVARTGQPIVIRDAAEDDRSLPSLVGERLAVGPLMAIPLMAPGRCLGALLIGNGHGERSFSRLDVEMATTFAGHAALALEFARAETDLRRLTVVEDRNRIARDLHDVVIQRLFAIGLRLEGLRSALPSAEAVRLAATTEDLDETIDDIRNTIFSLRGEAITGRTLRSELLKLADQAKESLGFAPRVRFVGPIDTAVPEHIRLHLLATLREALSNAAKHARAGSVQILLTVGAGEVVLRVSDDGLGLPENRHESGLANMRHRAVSLGGIMTTSDAGDGGGLVLTWRVPTVEIQEPLTVGDG